MTFVSKYIRRLFATRARLKNHSPSSISSETQTETIPRITIPHKMVEQIHKNTLRKATAESHRLKPSPTSPLLISCKRKQFNHHQGQTYSGYSTLFLWNLHYVEAVEPRSHDYGGVKPVEFANNPSLATEQTDFTSLGINPALTDSLKDRLSLESPTNIQTLAIPTLLEGHNSLCVAETGSGKTYAYLLPMVEIMERQRELTMLQQSINNSPKFVVLVPTREIAQQIKNVADGLASLSHFSTRLVCGHRMVKDESDATPDIVIATPGALHAMLRKDKLSPSRLQMLVLDEVDTLMDDSFNATIRDILTRLKLTFGSPSGDPCVVSTGTQVALVGATVPRDMHNIIGDLVPIEGLEKVTTDSIHRLLPHVPQKFVRVLPSTKPEYLLEELKSKRSVPTIIFCNRNGTAWWVSQFLESNGVDNLVIHGRSEEREGTFDRFQAGESNVLVATDVCSRGLDTLRVERIINYEFPSFVSDYIHRVGRVGRVGSHTTGRVVSFVSQKWEVDVLGHIEESARKSQEIYNVNANIKRKITGIVHKKFRQNIRDDSENT